MSEVRYCSKTDAYAHYFTSLTHKVAPPHVPAQAHGYQEKTHFL